MSFDFSFDFLEPTSDFQTVKRWFEIKTKEMQIMDCNRKTAAGTVSIP